MKFYTTEKLGPKMSLTPEGFLLCEDVPVARTGTMIYGPGETPVEVGPDGIARIERLAEEVFRPETMASFNGKAVVDEHPMEDVRPENWRELAVGTMFNPHRGVGIQDDILLADLLITHHEAIPAVREGKREVSCGYDADYDIVMPGLGRQRNIVGNHVALVDAGRCGPRCAIGDSALNLTKGKKRMKRTLAERIMDAFKKKDEGAMTAMLDELPEEEANSGAVVIHNHMPVRDADKEDEDEDDKKDKKTNDAMDSRMTKMEDAHKEMAKDIKMIKDAVMKDDKKEDDEEEEEEKKDKTGDEAAATSANRKIEGNLEEEAPPGTADKARKARDSAYLVDSFQDTIALAEIIAPGIGIPTVDAKAAPGKTYDALCRFRRSVLDVASAQPETRSFIDEVLGGHELKQLSCSRVRDVFRAVGTFKKNSNNDAHRTSSFDTTNGGFGSGTRGEIQTPAQLNKRMREIYK